MTENFEQKTRGRPKLNNAIAVEAILSSPEKREVFRGELEKLRRVKESINSQSKFYGDDLKSTAEAFALSKGFLGKLVADVIKGDPEKIIADLTNHIDLIQELGG